MASTHQTFVVDFSFACSHCVQVASFTREKQVVANYNKLLATIYKSELIVGLHTGLFTGLILFTMSCYYALAVWFGAKLVLQKVYTGGDVFTVPLALGISSL